MWAKFYTPTGFQHITMNKKLSKSLHTWNSPNKHFEHQTCIKIFGPSVKPFCTFIVWIITCFVKQTTCSSACFSVGSKLLHTTATGTSRWLEKNWRLSRIRNMSFCDISAPLSGRQNCSDIWSTHCHRAGRCCVTEVIVLRFLIDANPSCQSVTLHIWTCCQGQMRERH